MGSVIRSKIKNAKDKLNNIKSCDICEGEIPKENIQKQIYLCECEHKKNFCESCLHHYVIFKVNNFEEVLCPR